MRKIGLLVTLRLRNRISALAAVAILLLTTGPLQAQLGVSQSTVGLGYGFAQTSIFTSAIDAAAGGAGNVTVVPDLSGSLAGFFSILIDLRDFNFGANTALSVAEVANLSAFIASGRRVLIFGENASWSTWNNSFLNLLGGSSVATGGSGLGTPLVANSITAGVGAIQPGAPGIAIGGTPLFTDGGPGPGGIAGPYVNLWGANQNVLTILDTNTCNDLGYVVADNNVFCDNVASWLAGSQVVVPEPMTVVLLGTGLLGLAFVHRRRKQA